MEDILLTLNQPLILWSLFAGAILAVLVDYLFPVDWLAYVGYALFSLFVGATVPATPTVSLIVMAVVTGAMLILHYFVFSKFLTNAPRYDQALTVAGIGDDAPALGQSEAEKE